ncbi:cobalamin-dependent protein [candidate division CSSED10-310 bacterium]|uniref:Cobalamin-dependent protein n=1 Tax=candidate division CSSED10-310 bacterium TaxID=2855610 RepID=A0ABV6Z5C2_UNCC1
MRILFINKGNTMQELLGIVYLSAVLKEHGHRVEMVLMSRQDPLQFATSYKPDILAYSTTTGLHHEYLAVNRTLKKKVSALAIFGGPHPTFFPEMIAEQGVDAVIGFLFMIMEQHCGAISIPLICRT